MNLSKIMDGIGWHFVNLVNLSYRRLWHMKRLESLYNSYHKISVPDYYNKMDDIMKIVLVHPRCTLSKMYFNSEEKMSKSIIAF